jgi:hypothetical protein
MPWTHARRGFCSGLLGTGTVVCAGMVVNRQTKTVISTTITNQQQTSTTVKEEL